MKKRERHLRKLRFYSSNVMAGLVPDAYFRHRREQMLDSLSRRPDREELLRTVDQYCRIDRPFDLPASAGSFADIPKGRQNTYYFDLRNIVRHYPRGIRFSHEFGDVVNVPPTPTLVKSRPIEGDNANAVLMKFNQVRHYLLVKKDRPYEEKADRLVWRGKCLNRPVRKRLLKTYFDHPRFDVGDTAKRPEDPSLRRPYLSVADQLRNKFVLSLEGNDVATNLKWILSSNSICLMPRPRYETWFLEGTLRPGVHFVEVRPDLSDLEEVMDACLADPDRMAEIRRNARQHVERFRDRRRERLLQLLVMEKYLHLGGQPSAWPDLTGA